MGRKSLTVAGQALVPEWDPGLKELWHVNFEKEPVNDERWSCIVTAAIPGEAADDECIQAYSQCVNTGLRRAVKVLSMGDVVKVLKGSASVPEAQKAKQVKPKTEKVESVEKGGVLPPPPRFGQILTVAAAFATFTDVECKLPSDLMAAVLKYLILRLKDENCLQRRVDAVRARKARERALRARFVRNLKPYEVRREGSGAPEKLPPNILDLDSPIDDQPFNGPDLYILLTDIYDPFCFPELVRIGVPFLAVMKITLPQDPPPWGYSFTLAPARADPNSKKAALISDFWEKLLKACLEEADRFKDVAMMRYFASSFRAAASRLESLRNIFNELTWVQYSTYTVHRQHQTYLRELHVQRLFMSLAPLDLGRCDVYNAVCDLLVTGEPLTPALVLHAVVEQVVAGVPDTGSVAFEYEGTPWEGAGGGSSPSVVRVSSQKQQSERAVEYVTPCERCRGRVWENICEKLKKVSPDQGTSLRQERTESPEESSVQSQEEVMLGTSCESGRAKAVPSGLSEELRRMVSERRGGEREERRWKAPVLCFFGDRASVQMYHSEQRVLTAEGLVERFLKPAVQRVWWKYPEPPPGDRAFFNFHLASLRRVSKEGEEGLRVKLHFTIAMKLIGMAKSYMYRGEEQNLSESAFSSDSEKVKKLSKVKFEQYSRDVKGENEMASINFFKTFSPAGNFLEFRKKLLERERELTKSSLARMGDQDSLRKATGNFSMAFVTHRSSGMCFPLCLKQTAAMLTSSSSYTNHGKTLPNLSFILDLPEISNLIEPHFLSDKDEYLQLVQSFLYHESLEPHVMTQRLLEAEQTYNTTLYSYFPPTDSIVAVLLNDYDYRGVFYSDSSGVLPTPVSLRDFHNYVCYEILDWSTEEKEAYAEFVSKLQEAAKAEEERRDEEYLTVLTREYCALTPEEREEFLQTAEDLPGELEVAEEELEDLPVKESFCPPQRISFVATNLSELRVETRRRVHDFFSRDGTEVHVAIDSWLNEPLSLLTLAVDRPKLRLYYHQWLGGEETSTAFTLKTASDVIFSFFRDSEEEEEDFNYRVNMSWPTGLVVTPVFSGARVYIRQGYVRGCVGGRGGEERSRCFLRNGEVVVMREGGEVEVLCGSGTKYGLYESGGVGRYETTTMTGEVWEVRTKGPCRPRRRLRETQKVYIGSDPKTLETFYRREDGVSCMLWPNGRLVTKYSDGTKITSRPYFDGEVVTEWSEEEKSYFLEVESKQRLERGLPEPRSRTILRNSSTPKMSEAAFTVEAFVLISCSYLMEHPRYSSVRFSPEEPFVTVKIPREVTVLVYPEGNYEVRQRNHSLTVQGSVVEFSTTCGTCNNRSTATMNFQDTEYLCKVVDFFQKGFFVQRNGTTTHHENVCDSDTDDVPVSNPGTPSSRSAPEKCAERHVRPPSENQRCFAFQRDMSGVEFVHANAFARDFYELPEDTFFDFHSGKPPSISHTSSSPFYRVGHETWLMDYEEKDNSLPTDLKKSDLKELGSRDSPANLFKYPFPKHHNCPDPHPPLRTPKTMPKLIVARTICCLSARPNSVIHAVQRYVTAYQKKARDICSAHSTLKAREDTCKSHRHVQMRLKKIALTLNQSLKMYPHLCTRFPSTEKDIHYFGHFIQLMEEFRTHTTSDGHLLPDCKQIPEPLPRHTGFPPIDEGGEPS